MKRHYSAATAPCFASTSRHELKWYGEKWVGSARRLGQHAMIQHGAIRLGPSGDKLQKWLAGMEAVDARPWAELPSAERLAAALEEGMRGLVVADRATGFAEPTPPS